MTVQQRAQEAQAQTPYSERRDLQFRWGITQGNMHVASRASDQVYQELAVY